MAIGRAPGHTVHGVSGMPAAQKASTLRVNKKKTLEKVRAAKEALKKKERDAE